MMEYNKGYGMILMISNGYMTFGYIIMKYFIKEPTKAVQMSIWHHILAFTGFVGALVNGYSFPGISTLSMSCEISSIFLNYRDMFKDSRNSALGSINQVCFLLSYTVFRMIPFPFCVMRCFVQMMTTTHIVESPVRKIMHVINFIQAFLILLLNCYWYRLILIGLYKMLQENGICPKSKTNESEKGDKEM